VCALLLFAGMLVIYFEYMVMIFSLCLYLRVNKTNHICVYDICSRYDLINCHQHDSEGLFNILFIMILFNLFLCDFIILRL
jgi:hypothetical protein